jgi:predicted DNA-binding transcriptional regulator AlpA
MNEILTAKEVALELRCSRAQVYRLLNGSVKDVPQLPYISLGRKRVVRRSALEDWKRRNEGCIFSVDADSDVVARAS